MSQEVAFQLEVPDGGQGRSVLQNANCRRRLLTPILQSEAGNRCKTATGVASYSEN
jgi:hypothetical protein